MREIFPGVLHWTTSHPTLDADVSSYYVVPAGVAIDPMVPEGGLSELCGHGEPRQVVLTNANHVREAGRFAEAYGCVVRASPEAARRIDGTLDVVPYTAHEVIAPGVQALYVGILSPDEYALHLTATVPALALADGITHYTNALEFPADGLLGDDAASVKERLKQRFRALLEWNFAHLLFAHGDPILTNGKTALRDFVSSPAWQWGPRRTA